MSELETLTARIAELESKLATVKLIANALYRHECWVDLPFGPRKVLEGYVDEETKEAYGK